MTYKELREQVVAERGELDMRQEAMLQNKYAYAKVICKTNEWPLDLLIYDKGQIIFICPITEI